MVTCAAQTPKERRYLRGYLKRAAAVMMCCVLVVSLTLPPRAKAVVAESGFIASLIGVVMSSMGYTWTANGMNEQGFGDALEDVIVEYLNTEVGGKTIEEWALIGSSVAFSGNSTLLIQQGLMQKIMDFADWFSQKIGVSGGSSVPVYADAGSALLADGSLFYLSLWDVSQDTPSVLGSLIELGDKVVLDGGSYFHYWYDGASGSNVLTFFDVSQGKETWNSSVVSDRAAQYYFISFINGSYRLCSYNPYWKEFGYYTYPPLSALDLSVIDPASLALERSPGAQNPDIADDGTQAYKVTVANLTADDLEGLISAAVSQAIAGTLVTEGTVTDAVPIVSEGTMVGDISLEGIQAVQEDLSAVFISKFPFCIPWDFAKAVSLLAAPPQTPHWEVDFFGSMNGQYGVNWQGDTKIVIDFEDFELLGMVCRWTSTLMFCFVLITSTKRLIWTA